MTGKEILRQHLHGYSDEQFEDDIKHFPLSECLCALERVIVANQSDLTEVRAALEVERENDNLLDKRESAEKALLITDSITIQLGDQTIKIPKDREVWFTITAQKNNDSPDKKLFINGADLVKTFVDSCSNYVIPRNSNKRSTDQW